MSMVSSLRYFFKKSTQTACFQNAHRAAYQLSPVTIARRVSRSSTTCCVRKPMKRFTSCRGKELTAAVGSNAHTAAARTRFSKGEERLGVGEHAAGRPRADVHSP